MLGETRKMAILSEGHGCLAFLLLFSLTFIQIRNIDSRNNTVVSKRTFNLNQVQFAASNLPKTPPKLRSKRLAIFDGGGVVKLILGVAYPTKLSFKTGSLFYFYNIQLQYMPPPIPLYWWSFYDTPTFAARQQHSESAIDRSRLMVYEFIEELFERYKLPGSACLLRTICEVAAVEFDTVAGGAYKVLHELLNVLFKPQRLASDSKYLNAYRAGRYGANCVDLYRDCSQHSYWLNKLTILKEN